MYKQHQVVLVATDKAENALIIQGVLAGLGRSGIKHEKSYLTQEYLKSTYSKSFHLYILSEEKIEVGDWFFVKETNSIVQANNQLQIEEYEELNVCKKIIASTDKSLIISNKCWCMKPEVNGCNECTKQIPQIPQSFVEYFVTEFNKGDTIDKVNVEYEEIKGRWITPVGMIGEGYYEESSYNLKINSDNTINIKPIKESWSREELLGNESGSLDDFLLNSTKYTQEQREVIMEAISDWLQ